jgi:hypothetical protein
MCGNHTVSPYGFTADQQAGGAALHTICYTAPFVRCGEESPWTPLWNLHVHSKHTIDYKSQPCDCPTAADASQQS